MHCYHYHRTFPFKHAPGTTCNITFWHIISVPADVVNPSAAFYGHVGLVYEFHVTILSDYLSFTYILFIYGPELMMVWTCFVSLLGEMQCRINFNKNSIGLAYFKLGINVPIVFPLPSIVMISIFMTVMNSVPLL